MVNSSIIFVCELGLLTAIPAFGFEGHFTAAVSRGPVPGRSRGWRGPAFDRSYSYTRVLQSYSRPSMTFFLLSSIQQSDEDWRLLAFLSSSITSTDKNCSQTKKKKAMQALFLPQWRAPRIWVLPKWKTKIVGRPTASIGRSLLSKPKDSLHRHAKLELKERAVFPVLFMVQDFYRRSNTNCPFNHAQENLTTHELRRRLHEKFFAPGVKQPSISFSKDGALRKIKEVSSLCLWPQSFFPSFFLFFFF